MQRGGYAIKALNKGTDILSYDVSGSGYDCMVVILSADHLQTDHVIGIVGQRIIDGSHTQIMVLSKNNLDWCCGLNREYLGIQTGFLLRRPKKEGF